MSHIHKLPWVFVRLSDYWIKIWKRVIFVFFLVLLKLNRTKVLKLLKD
jgi:hypothetical protein